ncbi:hypothetical protein TSUD_231650 [Trifolium subterraneum]|uniref:Uncharacterized protein n=1 Tax=Trifolium subterraneum TaxID=3900 RepID=A0A2Z6MJE7_TRISU|nr:hypothetical protein TSUD_231650 [Trifolium subterraneum]
MENRPPRPQPRSVQYGARAPHQDQNRARMHPSSVPTRHQSMVPPQPQYGPNTFPELPGFSAHRPYQSQYGAPPTGWQTSSSQNSFPNMPQQQHPYSSSYPDNHQLLSMIHQLQNEVADLKAKIATLETEVASQKERLDKASNEATLPDELLPLRKRGRGGN